MASSCVVIPTLTTIGVSTSQRLVMTSTQSISTGPSSVSTTVFRTCSQPPNVSSRCQVTITTSFITFPGNTTTVTVPAILTVDVPVTVSTTLFRSSCSSSSSPSSSTPTSISSTPTPTPTSTDISSTTLLPAIITTPSPTVITTDSLVTSDGSTFTSFFTSTSTPPITVDAQSTGTPSDKKIAPGPIVGGVVGGIAALLLLGLLTWHLVKKQSKFSHFFSPDSHQKDPLLEKPSYNYGMVGQQSSNPVGLSPPDPSPAIQNAFGNGGGTGQASGPQGMFGNDAGLSQSTAGGQAVVGNDAGLGQASGQVTFGNDGGLGQASGQGTFGNDMGLGQSTTGGQGIVGDGGLGQTAGPPGALGTDGGLGPTVSGGPGVVGNLPPIIPLIVGLGTATAASGAFAAATSSRPSPSRPSSTSSSQPLLTKPQGSYPPALQNWNATHGYGQAYAGPSTSSNNNNNNGGLGPRLSHGSSTSSPSDNSLIGNSPTNYNAEQSLRNSFGRVPVSNGADYEYHPYAEIGSSSFSTGAGPSSLQAPSYDGRGRPLNILPEKVPLIHLDGSLYQRPPRDGPSSGNGPPAYLE